MANFALPAPRRGSIDSYSGLGRAQELGQEIHQRIQAERILKNPSYRAEVLISHCFERENFIFEVRGKMDGFLAQRRTKIEEIKSSFNTYELVKRLQDDPLEHPYCLQLRTYGYFHYLKTGEEAELVLHLVSTRNGEGLDHKISLDVPAYETWCEVRLQELLAEAELAEKRARRRRKASGALTFPFEKPRAGQIELIETVEEGMRESRPMFLQAPTGLGKTVGVLYPVLKEALSRGQRVLYVTPKNSQHAVAEDAMERLQEKGAPLKGMTLTAKSKMCFKNEPICNPNFCEFAKDHYTKVAENKLPEQLAKNKSLTARVFRKMAETYEVCPFELQLVAVQEADVLICDYNYAFAPRSSLDRSNDIEIDQSGRPNLVIDEVHNLPARAMDYYSPSLSVKTFERMREDAQRLPARFRKETLAQIEACIDIIEKCAPPGCIRPCKIKPPAADFFSQDAELRAFLSTYLNSDVEIENKDVVLRLCFYWSEFTQALEFVTEEHRQFFTSFAPYPAQIKITCCDASEILKARYDDYSQVVGFSATLKPFDYYTRLSGLKESNLKTAEFSSPFARSQRKLLIIPQISSKYSERERNYPRIADTIRRIARLKNGNYFAFFPSFEFLGRVFDLFEPLEGFELFRQTSGMHRDAVEEVLQRLKTQGKAHLIFAVQGGVFSEGIDYHGEMAIGAFVVGPPLPNFDLIREEMRKFYEENYREGFDYAYTYPAMAKAVQAAGRVIRSETDRGLIVLMDNRFTQTSYTKSMPRDWFDESPHELVSKSILSDVEKFWSQPPSPLDGP